MITDFSGWDFVWPAFLLVSIGLWIFCLIDILKNKFEKSNKITWIVAVIILPFLGSLLYLFLGRGQKLNDK